MLPMFHDWGEKHLTSGQVTKWRGRWRNFQYVCAWILWAACVVMAVSRTWRNDVNAILWIAAATSFRLDLWRMEEAKTRAEDEARRQRLALMGLDRRPEEGPRVGMVRVAGSAGMQKLARIGALNAAGHVLQSVDVWLSHDPAKESLFNEAPVVFGPATRLWGELASIRIAFSEERFAPQHHFMLPTPSPMPPQQMFQFGVRAIELKPEAVGIIHGPWTSMTKH